MKTKKHIILFIIGLSSIFIACNQNETECPATQVPYMIMKITNSSSSTFDSIYISNDSLTDELYSGTSLPSFVKVPLLLNSDTTLINFGFYNDSLGLITDTLSFEYTINLKMDDIECDFTTEFVLSAVTSTTHFIDSVIISTPTINDESNTHVKVYF